MTGIGTFEQAGRWVQRSLALYLLALGLESLACIAIIVVLWGVGDADLSSLSNLSLSVTHGSFIAMALCGLAQVAAYIVIGVLFLRLLYKAVKQAQGFTTPFTSVSAGWAVGYWFVPFLNLYRPLEVVKNLFKAYAAESGADAKPKAGEQLLGAWWALWLLGNIVSWIFFRSDIDVSTAAGMLTYAEFNFGVNILLIAGAVLFGVVVSRLAEATADASKNAKLQPA